MAMPTDVFPEYYIVRVNEFNDVARTPLEEWLDYLKNNRIKDDTSTPGLKEARQRLLYMTMGDADRKAYLAHMDNLRVQKDVIDTAKLEGHAEGLAEGLEKGIEKGIEKEKMAIAKNMKSAGLDVHAIMLFTGLTQEQIEQL